MIDKDMRFKAKGLVRGATPTTRPIQPLSSYMLCLLLLCVFCLFLTVSEAACNSQDRESLLWFSRNVSSSASPLKWNPSVDCCSWEGITCEDKSLDSRVTEISLPSRGLSGNLTLSVLNLHHLSRLDLSHNCLSGPLPPGLLSALDQLIVLDLSYNSFVGELPLDQAFGNVSNMFFPMQTVDLSSNSLQGEILSSSVFLQRAFSLVSFNVSNNSFTGPISSLMCKSSPQLATLDFSYNDFNGHISQGLGRCLRLRVLRAGFNNLFGEIPSDIYNLSELKQLFLPANQLTGKIDDNIIQLKKLTSLELYSNHLEGEIPMDIGELYSLQSLQLQINNITGTVPLSLANCTSLIKLNLRVNRLGGTLTELDFSRFQSLSILDLGNNTFTGDLPDKVFFCKSLTAIRFAGNKLTGQISPLVLELESLSFLSVSDNKLMNITGALSILQGCRKLSTLLMGKNFYNERLPSNKDFISPDGFLNLKIFASGGSELRGEIPVWLIKLQSLAVMDLSNNQLVGTIPGWLGTLPHLFYIDLSDNLLSGELPKEIFQLRALMSQEAYEATERNYLKLPFYVNSHNVTTHQQYNQLLSLPPAIYIRRNKLIGSIPVEVGLLKVLHVLDLSHNGFSASIPHEVSNLTNLERLDLSNNNLSGKIPWSLTNLHFMSYFNVANNSLEGPIPTGSQFDTFPKAHFEGNPLLFGGVLLTSGPVPTPPPPTDIDEEEELNRMFMMGAAIGGNISKEIFQLRALMSQEAYEATERNYLKLPFYVNSHNVTTHQQYNQLLSLPPAIYIRRNKLIGSIPVEVGLLKVLHVLDLSHNGFSASIPHEVSNLTNLERLDLSNNNLSGKIPWSLTNLHFMSYFNVANNSLEGPIPTGSQFDTFPKAHFEGNPLLFGGVLLTSGPVPTPPPPTDIDEEEELNRMFMMGAAIGGNISKEIFQLRALMSQEAYEATERNYLKLPFYVNSHNVTTHQQYNQLLSLPPAIYIRRNKLIGSIPVEVGLLKVLHVLDLSHNGFSASIPHEVSNLTNLERLDLSNNNLSGKIPWSLTNLHFMSYFNVANNSLEGPIPTGSQFDTFPKAHFEGNPLLFGGVLLTSGPVPTPPPPTDIDEEEELNRMFMMGAAIGGLFSFSSVLLLLYCYPGVI